MPVLKYSLLSAKTRDLAGGPLYHPQRMSAFVETRLPLCEDLALMLYKHLLLAVLHLSYVYAGICELERSAR